MNNTKMTTKSDSVTTKEKILEGFDEDFKKDNGELVEPTFKDPVGDFCPVRQFLSQAIDKVIEETRRETLADVMILIERYANESFEEVSNPDEVLEPARRK